MVPVMVLLLLRAEPVAWGVSVDSFRAPHFIIVQDVSRSAATQADAISVDKALCEFLKSNAAYFRGSSMQLIRFGRDVELVADHTVIGIEDVSAIVHTLQQAQRSDFWTETMSQRGVYDLLTETEEDARLKAINLLVEAIINRTTKSW